MDTIMHTIDGKDKIIFEDCVSWRDAVCDAYEWSVIFSQAIYVFWNNCEKIVFRARPGFAPIEYTHKGENMNN